MKDRVIPKLVYIPVIGIFIGIILIGTKYHNKMLNESNATIKCMLVHLLVPEMIGLLYVLIYLL
jgi:hypothetical protein